MNDATRRCWVVRTDRTVVTDLIAPELERGVLRQGWGWDRSQDLRVVRAALDHARGQVSDAQRSAWTHAWRLLDDQPGAIKATDLLVLPNTPRSGQWSIARADDGYEFKLASTGDHGHCRSVRLLRSAIDPRAVELPAALRRTMRCQLAMWNIDEHASAVAELGAGRSEPRRPADHGLAEAQRAAGRAAWQVLQARFGGAELERPVATVLEQLFDEVEHRGGPAENGADFLCRLTGPLGVRFTIAVQLKMWTGVADDPTPLRQLARAAESTALSGAVVMTTASSASTQFLAAADALTQRLKVPVRVVCREEFMRLLICSQQFTQQRGGTTCR